MATAKLTRVRRLGFRISSPAFFPARTGSFRPVVLYCFFEALGDVEEFPQFLFGAVGDGNEIFSQDDLGADSGFGVNFQEQRMGNFFRR